MSSAGIKHENGRDQREEDEYPVGNGRVAADCDQCAMSAKYFSVGELTYNHSEPKRAK